MGQEKSIGEFDIASIVKMTVAPVNEAVIDSKKGKDNKPQKTEITIKGGKDIAKAVKESGKQINSVQKAIGKVTKAPVEFVPDTSKVDKAKKEAEKPTESKVKLKTEKVDLPLLGKTPIKLSIDKDSRTAIKKTLGDAEKTSKDLIKAATDAVKKIGSANYLEDLNDSERQAISTAVSNVKKNNPGISEDKLKTFKQNLTLDRRAKKTHDTLSENFRLPSPSSKAYGQEMYDAAITAAKIQAAVKIREGLHGDKSYTQFLSENDKNKNYNGNTLKIPGKFIDQIQTGLYEHFGVNKLGTALSSGGKWTGIQDRMAQSIDSFGAGLSAAINASSGKRITKEFQARIDSAVKTAVGMSIDDAISHLSGTKGTKESKKALSLLDRKQNGEYKYSIDDIYDILRDRTPTGKNAIAKEDAVSGVNYKGFSDLFAALQVYQRSGSSKLDKDHIKRLSELVNVIVSEVQNSTYNAKTVIDSINTSLNQAQIETEKMAKEQPKIEKKTKSEKSSKSSKNSSSATPKKKQTSTTKIDHYVPNIEGDSTYAKLANQNYTTKSKEEALRKLSESFETWNDALPDTHSEHALKYIYRRYMLEAYQMGASIDELSKFSLTDLSNKSPEYFVNMVEKAGEQFEVFADLYDYVASINKSLLKKNVIKNLLDSIAKGQLVAKGKFGESLALTDSGNLIGTSESYELDFVKRFVNRQKGKQQKLNNEISRITGEESNVNVLPEYYNSLLELFEPSTFTPKIKEQKIKATVKAESKKVEQIHKTEEPKKAEKKVEQKQPDKKEKIEEPKYSFAPRLTKNNQEKRGSRFTGRLYDQKQLLDFASAPLNRSPKIKSNSGIFDKNGNYYVVSGNKAPDYVYKRIQYKPHTANSAKESGSLRSHQELVKFSKRPATEIPEPDNTEELLAEIDKQIKEELYVKPKKKRIRKKSKKEKADIDSIKKDLKKKNSVYKEAQEQANSTDATLSDMMAVSDAELNRLNAIKKARSEGVSEKDLKKILGSNVPSNDELEKAIVEAQNKKIGYSSATATYDKKTPNSYAEKQISQGPVPDFDQTRVRSQVDDSYKPKYKVVKKSPVIKTGPKIGYDNGRLYHTADIPDDFSGLKQLSQRESAAGKKLVKTYQDVDKSIITLTQTYEENEETGISGWKNSASRYSDFKALGTEATKITNKILEQKADLDTEMSKPDDKRNQNKIKELKDNIKANQVDRREIADIARSIANDSSNNYKFSDFVDAVSKDSREQRNALNATKKANAEKVSKQSIDSIISQYDSYMKGIQQIESKTKDLRRVKQTGNEDVAKSIQTELDGLKETFSGAEDFVKKHESTLGKDRVNAYKTKQSKIKSEEQGILDDHQSAIDQKDFADSYTAAISKVNELKQAYSDLFKIQTKGANGELTGSELKSQIEGQTRLISKLKNETTDFWDQVYSKNKNNPDSILNNKLFSSYEKAFADTQDYSNFNGDKNNIIVLMQKAYQNQRDAQISALKAASKGDAYGIEKNKALSNNYKNAYESIRAQVVAQFGKDVANNALNGIKSDANNRQTIESGNAYSSLIKQIDAYVASVEKAGKASSAFREHFENLKNGLTDSKSNFDKSRNHQGMLEFIDKISDSKFSFDNLKDYYKSGFGSSELDFTERMNKLTGFGDSSNKIDSYFTKIDKFQNRYNDIIDQLNNKQIDTKTAKSGIKEIVSEMDDLIKVSDKYNKVTNKGEYIDGTAGRIHNWKDVSNALDSYAKSLNAVEVGTAKINEATGQVTKTYKVNGDDIITLTGNIEKYGDALRMIQKLQSGSGSGGTGSLLAGLKNLVSGNFKSIVGEIGSSVANVQILGQAFQQMKDGFNTFLDFNKGLTNISYTMDMSKEQLSSLGSSAIDMAKDLSMSLDNTMDIYQIYANMNTTSKEIQETAKPTAILSNLSGVDASTAADQVQGILQQFHMLEDGSTTAADASMHVVDVLDKISGNIGMDYAKGIKVISDAVQASGQVAYDAGMSYEQLAAVSAKVAERTREDGSSIGNAMKTIITRISKVGSMPEYAADVSNEDLSQASESLHKVGVEVYNTDGSFRDLDTILSELNAKWDGLTDAQKANISYNVAATRQTSKFKNILEAWTDSMNLANEATTTSGNAEANQEKYMESFSGKIQAIKTQMDEFWLNFYNSDQVSGALDFVQGLTEVFTGLEEAIGPIPTLITAVFSALTVKNAAAKGLEFLVGKDGQASGLANAVG